MSTQFTRIPGLNPKGVPVIWEQANLDPHPCWAIVTVKSVFNIREAGANPIIVHLPYIAPAKMTVTTVWGTFTHLRDAQAALLALVWSWDPPERRSGSRPPQPPHEPGCALSTEHTGACAHDHDLQVPADQRG